MVLLINIAARDRSFRCVNSRAEPASLLGLMLQAGVPDSFGDPSSDPDRRIAWRDQWVTDGCFPRPAFAWVTSAQAQWPCTGALAISCSAAGFHQYVSGQPDRLWNRRPSGNAHPLGDRARSSPRSLSSRQRCKAEGALRTTRLRHRRQPATALYSGIGVNRMRFLLFVVYGAVCAIARHWSTLARPRQCAGQ